MLLEEITLARLSLAVYLIDPYRGGRTLGNVNVSLQGLNSKPIRNPGGYYLFFNIPKDVVTPRVTGGDYYFDEEKEVRLSDLDTKNPIITITLTPAPAYPFSPSETLIRGCLRDSGGRGIPYANVMIKYTDIRTTTAEHGEFVIFFKKLKKDDIVTTAEGKKLVKIKRKDPVLEFKHSDFKNKSKTVETEVGRTNSLTIAYS